MKIFIVIPAYNEERVIGKVIDDIKKEGFKNIIVVDDGSTDNTYKIASSKKGVIVVKHLINRGKGAAVKTGFEAAKILSADYVITIDGDGQHNPKDIKKVLQRLKQGYDVVLGSRFLSQNKIPFKNRIYNLIGNLITYLFYGILVSDSQSGFRGYSKKALKSINTDSEDYEFDSEVIREIKKNNLKYCEIPIDVFYTPYSLQKTKKQGLLNGIKTLTNMLLKEL